MAVAFRAVREEAAHQEVRAVQRQARMAVVQTAEQAGLSEKIARTIGILAEAVVAKVEIVLALVAAAAVVAMAVAVVAAMAAEEVAAAAAEVAEAAAAITARAAAAATAM